MMNHLEALAKDKRSVESNRNNLRNLAMNVNTHQIETVTNEQDANKLVAYYVEQGFEAAWYCDVDGSYTVESWETKE